MKTQNIEISVLINGNDTTEYRKDDNSYIEARNGTEYAIRLKNHNSFRTLVILGVDGINVIDSKPLGDSPNERGYILEAGIDTIIKGYRVDDVNVAAFKFTSADKSYANKQKGMAGKTNGVISAKVYREKVKDNNWEIWAKKIKEMEEKIDSKPYIVPLRPDYYWWYDSTYTKPYATWSSASASGETHFGSACNDDINLKSHIDLQGGQGILRSCNFTQVVDASAYKQQETKCSVQNAETPFSLGSTFGKKVIQEITEVPFEIGSLLCSIALYYAPRAGLESLGVELKKTTKVSKMPQAFPAAKNKYCEVPSEWTG